MHFRVLHIVAEKGGRYSVLQFLLYLCLFIMSGCVTSTPHQRVDSKTAQEVKAGSVAPGLAEIVVFKGEALATLPLPWHSSLPGDGDFRINGAQVGAVTKGEALAVRLPAGNYSLSWINQGDDQKASEPLLVHIEAGQTAYFSLDLKIVTGYRLGENWIYPIMRQHQDGLALIQDLAIVVSKVPDGLHSL